MPSKKKENEVWCQWLHLEAVRVAQILPSSFEPLIGDEPLWSLLPSLPPPLHQGEFFRLIYSVWNCGSTYPFLNCAATTTTYPYQIVPRWLSIHSDKRKHNEATRGDRGSLQVFFKSTSSFYAQFCFLFHKWLFVYLTSFTLQALWGLEKWYAKQHSR